MTKDQVPATLECALDLLADEDALNAAGSHKDRRYVAINVPNTTSLDIDPSAYGLLGPCGSPYRMPLALLPEAIRRIHACAIGEGNYINPWTMYCFQEWTLLYRFDFLLYEFTYSNHPNPKPIKEIFLLSERCLPDAFYTTVDMEADFGRADFKPYRIPIEYGGRPKAASSERLSSARLLSDNDAMCHYVRNAGCYSSSQMSTQWVALVSVSIAGLIESKRRSYYTASHHFPYMSSPQSPLQHFTPLRAASPVTYYGPTLTPAQFRRVFSTCSKRLMLFDIIGTEGPDIYGPVYVVPTEGVSVTTTQLDEYKTAAELGHHRCQRVNRKPRLSHLVHSSCHISQYTVSDPGPMLGDGDWSALWALLDHNTRMESFEHPQNILRQPDEYQYTVTRQKSVGTADFKQYN
ncbi:hypothetical protein P154DRAFT_578584 [Amniculicola lignicola CBS 123094]|uniref:Uncharacterized protein n=1 Tax=Amniculicola lignicola CBS 123094 TaxID=1392246 RepID=A0A6A5W7C4_9PLEO|nr:hypothetical protein P154DRAFT_578584 [Amniculicola lignicola CBS 123094]